MASRFVNLGITSTLAIATRERCSFCICIPRAKVYPFKQPLREDPTKGHVLVRCVICGVCRRYHLFQ
jgi:hypothetical protein